MAKSNEFADVLKRQFASTLKMLREKAGLTQQELADKAGMTKAGIANLEQGRTAPAWPTVVVLCQALGVKCDAFAPDAVLKKGRPARNPK